MSLRGMWTKHYTLEGSAFYYNASLSKSRWTPPVDGVVHEAEKLKPPTDDSVAPEAGEVSLQEVSSSETTELPPEQTKPVDPSETTSNSDKNVVNSSKKRGPDPAVEDMTDKLLQAVASQQQQIKSKRSKGDSKSVGSNSQKSDYQKLVNTYEAMAGEKAEEGSKWLVR